VVTRGVLFDVGHGRGSLAFHIAQRVIAQGFLPGTISTDLHHHNPHGPVFDMDQGTPMAGWSDM